MQLISQTNWPQVYEEWKRTETEKDYWRTHFERKGFANWEEFRENFIENQKKEGIDLKNSSWEKYEISAEELGEFECVPHTKWDELAQKTGSRKMKDLAKTEHFKDHDKIKDLKENFPKESALIAIKKDGKIILIEGHHRAIAICQMLKGESIFNEKIILYLA